MAIKQTNLKTLADSLKKVREYRQEILEEIQRFKLSNSDIWKKSSRSTDSLLLKVGDIVYVKGSTGSTTSFRLGIIIGLTTITAEVQTVSPTGQKSTSRFLVSELVLAVSC